MQRVPQLIGSALQPQNVDIASHLKPVKVYVGLNTLFLRTYFISKKQESLKSVL